MYNRRSILTSVVSTLVAITRCKHANATDNKVEPTFLHAYSSNRGSEYDQDRQNRRVTRSTASEWVRVVTLLIVPDTPVFIRLPGGRDPDITIGGCVYRRGCDKLEASLNISWDDSYITEQHKVSGVISLNGIHSSSTIHCRYVFSRLKDPYDALDVVLRAKN